MINEYSVEQSSRWDQIVRSFNQHDAYWLSGYVKAFRIHGDGEPLLLYYEDANVRGINVVMMRDIADDPHFAGRLERNTYFDITTPYGYGGWLIEGNDSCNLFREYEKWCADNGIISEFVRFHPLIGNHRFVEQHYEIVPLGTTVVLHLSSPEVIWENFTSKNRNMIRKAQKNGIEIFNGTEQHLFEEFRKIYNRTMEKDSADKYYFFEPEFYESIYRDLPQNAQVFYAVLDGTIIAASIFLVSNGKMNYHLSGSIDEFSSMAPTNLIIYQAALWGCANGCKTLYLGGGVGSGEDGLYRFKKSFYRRDDLPRFHIGKKIYNQRVYNELLNMREALLENGFFPKYRA